MPRSCVAPDDPVTGWPGPGIWLAIRNPAARRSTAQAYLRRRCTVSAANMYSWRTSTMLPSIASPAASKSASVPRPTSTRPASRPLLGVGGDRTREMHSYVPPEPPRRSRLASPRDQPGCFRGMRRGGCAGYLFEPRREPVAGGGLAVAAGEPTAEVADRPEVAHRILHGAGPASSPQRNSRRSVRVRRSAITARRRPSRSAYSLRGKVRFKRQPRRGRGMASR